jgi:hypothetical protein
MYINSYGKFEASDNDNLATSIMSSLAVSDFNNKSFVLKTSGPLLITILMLRGRLTR